MRGIPEGEVITTLETNEITLNKIQLTALMRNINKVRLMMKWSDMEYSFHIEDKKNMIIWMQFDWNWKSILFRVCPWKILSKQILKWK